MIRVLIVDDEPLICEFIRDMIDWEQRGMECVGFADDGLSALKKAKQHMPELVITDIRMPGLTGIELMRKIKEISPQCNFIVISGYQDFSYIKLAVDLGAVSYILKPIDQSELEATLDKIQNSIESREMHEDYNKKRDENVRLRQQLESGKSRLGVQMLEKALKGEQALTQSLEELNETYAWALREGAFYVLVAVADHLDVADDEIMRSKALDGLSTLLTSALDDVPLFLQECEIGDDRAYLLNAAPAHWGQIEPKIREAAARQDPARCSIVCTFGVDQGGTSDLGELAEAYSKGKSACMRRITEGAGGLILAHAAKKHSGSGIHSLGLMNDKWKAKFRTCLDLKDAGQASELLAALFDKLFAMERVEPNWYYELFESSMQFVSSVLSQDYPDILREIGFAELAEQALRSVGTMPGLKFRATSILTTTLAKCEKSKIINEHKFISLAKAFVAEHYMEKITVSNIAGMLHINPDYFSTLFKKNQGIGFVEYLTEYRIDLARNLLKQKDVTVNEAAALAGYDDAKYFSKTFKKVVGASPKDYRRLFE